MFYKYQSSRTADFDLIINDSIRHLEGTNRGSESEVIVPLYLMSSFISFPVRSDAIQWVMNNEGTLVDNDETFFVDGVGVETRTIQPARSYLFDGVDDYILASKLIDINISSPYSICLSINFDDVSTNQIPLTNINSSNNRIGIHIGGLFVRVAMWNGVSYFIRANKPITTGIHKIIATWNGTDELHVYVDNSIGTNDVGSVSTFSIEGLSIGAKTDGNDVCNGNIWDVRIFDRVITDDERILYQNKKSISDATLLYKCDETEENPTSYDSSGNANHGTKNNVTYSTFHNEDYFFGSDYQNQVGYSVDGALGLIPRDEKNPVLDVLGNSLEFAKRAKYNVQIKGSNCGTFDGVNDSINFSNIPVTSFNNQMSFGGYFNTTTLSANQTIFGGSAGTTSILRIKTDGELQFWATNAGSSIVLSGFTSIINTTYKYLITYDIDLSEIKLYIDDVLKTTKTYNQAWGTIGNFMLGVWGGSLDPFNGQLYDQRIWQKILTDEERTKFFNGEQTATELLSLPFSEGAGTKIYDISGNDNHGDANNITESTFWGTTQDTFHYNILDGFSLYEHSTEDEIRVPYKSDGTPLTITPPSGYTKTSDNPSGNWHNNAESYLEQQQIPQMVQADEEIKYWYGTNLTKDFVASDFTNVSNGTKSDDTDGSVLVTQSGAFLISVGVSNSTLLTVSKEYKVRFRAKSNVAQSNGFTSIGDGGDTGVTPINPNLSTSYQSYEFTITPTGTNLRLYTTVANLGDSFNILDLQAAATSDDTPNPIYYEDFEFDVYDYIPYHQIFANVSTENRYKDSLTYATEQTGTTLDKIYTFINDQIMRDQNGEPMLDQDGNIIYIN